MTSKYNDRSAQPKQRETNATRVHKPCSTLLVLGILTLLASSASGQTWQTVDDFQYAPGPYHATANGITSDPAGNVFVAGTAVENFPFYAALVQKSPDAGNSWTISENFVTPYLATYYGITTDTSGNVYAVGIQNPGGGIHWLVSQTADGGNSWSTIDDFTAPGTNYYAESVSTDSAGNVYVAGYSITGSPSIYTWIVRKGVKVSNSWTWTTVDSLSPYSNAEAWGIFCHPNGSIFVTGQATVPIKKGTSIVWTTRRSLDGGSTWATVDSFSTGAQGRGLGADSFGNVYAVGVGGIRKSTDNGSTWTTVDTAISANAFARDPAGNLFVVGASGSGASVWTVRESAGSVGAWTTVDTYQLSSGKNANARAVMSDATGRIYVAGVAANASGINNWIVRKR